MITGPILLRTFHDVNSVAPYPAYNTVGGNPGEIVTCSKTGRMWILQKNGSERVYIPVRPEFRYSDPLAGVSEAGVKGYTFSSGPSTYQGLELYGPTKVTGSSFEVSNLVLINNTAAAFKTKIQGQKGIYLYKLDVGTGNDVLAPDIPSLGTNEFGEIVATESYALRNILDADLPLTPNTSTEIVDLRSSTGTTGEGKSVYVEAVIQFNHTGSHVVTAALYDHSLSVYISSSKVSMNGWAQVKLSGFAPAGNQIRVYVQCDVNAVVKAQVGTYNSPATHITLTETRYPDPSL